jgi:hypothetical protein
MQPSAEVSRFTEFDAAPAFQWNWWVNDNLTEALSRLVCWMHVCLGDIETFQSVDLATMIWTFSIGSQT